jgi:hypothetical protein
MKSQLPVIVISAVASVLVTLAVLFMWSRKNVSDCAHETERFCPAKGDLECLSKNFDLFPEPCRNYASQLIRAGLTGCKSELEEFCPQVLAGGGRLKLCLMNFKSNLGPACLSQIDPPKPMLPDR